MIGDRVYIKNEDNIHFNEWGTIVDYDGKYYHVAIFGDNNCVAIFERNELYIPREKEAIT